MVDQNKESNPETVASQNPEKSPIAIREEHILKFWKEKNIFEESLKQTEKGKEFVFYDGPPFGTGLPHYGHILPGTIKDAIPRFKTMQGYYVRRRWGWDCHGLPVENLIEKELGLKSKKDIIDYGIDKFNTASKGSVLRYADDWKKIIPRTGRWVNMEDDYKTMDTTFTESVWWAFHKLYTKDLIYEGYKVMQVCPRCETSLSNFEVNQGYKDITDISVYAKFALKDDPKTFFLAWTTTPWTLPGNVALAINSDVDYVKIEISGLFYILAKARLQVVKETYNIVEEFKGKKIIGTSYVPVFDYYLHEELDHKQNAWKVWGADFVTTEDGTGIVHIAPAFGADDYELAKKEKLPVIQHVTAHGEFKKEVKDFAGQFVKPKEDSQKTDVEIIKNLAHRGLLFAKEKIVHSYPHCWRCETPLLNYATSSWFVGVTKIKDQLISENQKINWIPAHVKEGRFGKWLEGARDWAVSRSRFWGAPLPVWKCASCEKTEVLESIGQLREKLSSRNSYFVMRHGQSENNLQNILNTSLSQNHYSLTPQGREDVLKNAKKLKKEAIDLIYTSPFLRTKETAEVVRVALGLPVQAVKIEPLLHEINAGVYDGKTVDEYHKFFYSYEERFTKRPEGGENQMDVKKRVGRVLQNIDRLHEGKKILFVTHDGPAWLLISAALGLSIGETLKIHSGKKFFLENAETRAFSYVPLPHNDHFEVDLHRPGIDAVTFPCSCGGVMKRVPEVFDCWFESGAMSFAQWHYPFENKDIFEPKGGLFGGSKSYPADFIAEGLDQTRGWFYTMLVLGVALFGKSPYKNVVTNGLILAEDGRKMSKSLKNYPDPMDLIHKYGADALRLYLMSQPVVKGEELRFSEKGVDEVYKKNILRLQNVVSFYEMYAGTLKEGAASPHVLDRWIISRLNEVVSEVENSLESYEMDKSVRPIELFVDDLSTWYLRRSRDRFKSDFEDDKQNALRTMKFVLTELAKTIAPLTPFLAEDIYKRVGGEKESVHLERWVKGGSVDIALHNNMAEVRRLVSLGLEIRSKNKLNVRQPLSCLKMRGSLFGLEFLELIRDEVNVKEVIADSKLANEVELVTEITPELKEEGSAREFMRAIQELRKNSKLTIQDVVVLSVEVDEKGQKFIKKFEKEIKQTTNVREIIFGQGSVDLLIADMSFKVNLLK
jgi:isoleucyl-tRNA synthetase